MSEPLYHVSSEVLLDVDDDTIGIDADDDGQILYDMFVAKVQGWSGRPLDAEWKATYELYTAMRTALGSEGMAQAWALAKAGDPDWAELKAFSREKDRRREARPDTAAWRKRYRRSPEVKERERLRAKSRRIAAREARAS